MLAFDSQRFGFLEEKRRLGGLSRHRQAGSPLDSFVVDFQFAFAYRIIENCHLTISDYNQLLFLKGVEPTHKYVCAYAPCKLHAGNCDIFNSGLKVTTAKGSDCCGG